MFCAQWPYCLDYIASTTFMHSQTCVQSEMVSNGQDESEGWICYIMIQYNSHTPCPKNAWLCLKKLALLLLQHHANTIMISKNNLQVYNLQKLCPVTILYAFNIKILT